MKERRVVLFVLAGVLFVAALAGVFWYLNTADERAARDVELVDALVAIESIPAGSSGQNAIDNGWIGFEERERQTIPDNIVRDVDELEDLISAADISENQFITTDSFVARERATRPGGLVGQISIEGDDEPSPRQAVAISLEEETTVNMNVVAGDTVNVIASTLTDEGRVAAYIVTNAPVIGGGTGTADDGGGGTIVVLSLEPDDVLKLVAAQDQDNIRLWLTLIPHDYDTPSPDPVIGNVPALPYDTVH